MLIFNQIDFAANINSIGPHVEKSLQDRDEQRQLVEEKQRALASAINTDQLVLQCRDLMIKQVYSDSVAFIDDCQEGKIAGFEEAEWLWTILHRNEQCSRRLRQLEEPNGPFRVARAAYIAASRDARGYRSRARTPSVVEVLANEDQCRQDFEARRGEIERQRAAEEERTTNFLMDDVLPILTRTGVLPPRGWPSSESGTDSSVASLITQRYDGGGGLIPVDVPQEEEDREWHVAEVERTRDGLAAWVTHASHSLPYYQCAHMDYMFTHPKATQQDFDEYYARREGRSLARITEEGEEGVRVSRERYLQSRADAEEDGVSNLPFSSTDFGAGGSDIASGGRQGADDLDKRIIRKCE